MSECQIVPGDQVYLRVFRRKWNELRREGTYKVVRTNPTTVQVEGSPTLYNLNHCSRVPKVRTETEGNRQANNSGESDKERPVTQDVQNDGSSKTNVQGAHILLPDKPERKNNKSDNISDDHHKPNASNLANPIYNQQHPDSLRIVFSTLI